ncbi:hypothetical protein CRENBAI_010296 [Crenichthys baileyi]|uniref:Uncharacterized protein n=1 Tax=Crenichthys baileyi TaxID=28760 RepID=A0AAV9SE32_9TELE
MLGKGNRGFLEERHNKTQSQAACMSPGSQSRTLTAQSFQLLNNTKQTVTYFQSREQAREKTWSRIQQGSGRQDEWRTELEAGQAVTDRPKAWFSPGPKG